MKQNKWFQGLLIFFAIVGFISLGGSIFFVATNQYNVGNLFKVIWLTENRALESKDKSTLVEGAIAGIVDSLEDPYSVYYTADQFKELNYRLQGSFNGIGIVVGAGEDEKIMVVAPIKDSPADRAGVKSGDVVTAINGESTKTMTVDSAVKLIRGEPGTEVELKVFRETVNKEITFKIKRENITLDSVDSKTLDKKAGIGYIQITHFTAKTPDEFNEHLQKVIKDGAKALVLDLREDPGGDFNSAVEVADTIMNKGDIVKIVNRAGDSRVYTAVPEGLNIPMVVLINEGSASASEILAGALKDNKLAVLVGQKSFGKGLVQTVYPLSEGDALVLTTDKYYTPNNIDINKKGISPDFVVSNTVPGGDDLQLARGVEILKTKLK